MRARPIPAHVPSSMDRTGQCSCRNTRRARRASEWRRRRPQPIPPCTPPFAVTQHLTTPTTFRVPLHSPPPRDFKHPPFAVTQHLTTPTTFRDPRLPSFAVTQLLTIPRTFPSPPANLARLTEPYGFARWYARLAVTRDGSLDAPLPTPSPSPLPSLQPPPPNASPAQRGPRRVTRGPAACARATRRRSIPRTRQRVTRGLAAHFKARPRRATALRPTRRCPPQ